MKAVGDQDAGFRVPAYTLAGLLLLNDERDKAKGCLESVFRHPARTQLRLLSSVAMSTGMPRSTSPME